MVVVDQDTNKNGRIFNKIKMNDIIRSLLSTKPNLKRMHAREKCENRRIRVGTETFIIMGRLIQYCMRFQYHFVFLHIASEEFHWQFVM